MEPKDESDTSPLTSPPSTDPSVGLDYVSSYTQISRFNDVETGDQTDVELSDDELDDYQTNLPTKVDASIPELASEIVEWSKKAFQSFDETEDSDRPTSSVDLSENQSSIIEDRVIQENKLEFFQMKFLLQLEDQATCIAQDLNRMVNYLSDFSANATSTTVHVMKVHHDTVLDTCDSIDSNIKLMYKIISKCEELNKSLKFLDDLKNKIKDIKQNLDTLEKIIS